MISPDEIQAAIDDLITQEHARRETICQIAWLLTDVDKRDRLFQLEGRTFDVGLDRSVDLRSNDVAVYAEFDWTVACRLIRPDT